MNGETIKKRHLDVQLPFLVLTDGLLDDGDRLTDLGDCLRNVADKGVNRGVQWPQSAKDMCHECGSDIVGQHQGVQQHHHLFPV